MKSIAYYRQKIEDRGLFELVVGRLAWYRLRLTMDNWYVGRMVELLGNRVTIDGVKLNVDNPLVTTRHKGSLFFNIYENAERELAAKYLDRNLPTVEIGGSIGGVSCTVNRMLRKPREHVVVECNPVLLPTLEANRALNNAAFTIEPVALAYGQSSISFTISDHFMLGGTQGQSGRTVTVPATTLSDLLAKHQFGTINLVSDCEGAEVALVENEADLFRSHVKWFVVETHADIVGAEIVASMVSKLEEVGFHIRERSRGGVLAMENLSLGYQ